MKKIVVLFLLLLLPVGNVLASSGSVKKSSVIECDGKFYGSHGNPAHYHIVVNKNGKYYAKGDEVKLPSSCSLKKNDVSGIKEIVELSSCVDGDTAKFKTKDGIYTTRFLAVDTPETKHPKKKEEPFGKEASNFTCNSLKKATIIELEFDVNSEKYDKYNRLLAWVFVDGKLLQEQLVSEGLADVAYLYGNYKYTSLLEDTLVVARNNKVGKWNEDRETNDNGLLDRIVGFFNKITNNLTDLLQNML